MEVPVINRVGDLQMVIGRVPTLISRVLIEQVPEIFSFWKWGALILAVYAIVNSLLVSFRIQLVRFRNRQSAVTKALLSYTSDDDDYSSDEDDDDDDCSVSSSSVNEDEEYNEDEEVEKVKDVNDAVFSSFFNFRLKGCSSEFEKEVDVDDPTCRFTWSNFANGKSVVKLWDGIGLGLDLNNASGSIVSIHNLDNHPSVVLSAAKDEASHHRRRHPFISLVDKRVGRQPVITNWGSSEVGKVRVVDLRKATEDVDEAADWSGVTWWDANVGDDDVARL